MSAKVEEQTHDMEDSSAPKQEARKNAECRERKGDREGEREREREGERERGGGNLKAN